jgi:hypothetical protein
MPVPPSRRLGSRSNHKHTSSWVFFHYGITVLVVSVSPTTCSVQNSNIHVRVEVNRREVSFFRCSIPPSNPVYPRRVDPSSLVSSLSSYRHSYIGLLFNSHFVHTLFLDHKQSIHQSHFCLWQLTLQAYMTTSVVYYLYILTVKHLLWQINYRGIWSISLPSCALFI